jgi:GTP-binding protein
VKPQNVTFTGSASSSGQFPRDGLPEVAFLGRSNVGKSSLLNALAGTKGLARVSSEPGRTRLVNFFRVRGAARLGGAGRGDLYLVDLPGYGYAKVPLEVRESWKRLVSAYLEDRDVLRLCVLIVDARHEPTEADEQLREWLDHHRATYVVAANKIDKLGRGEARRRERELRDGIGKDAKGVVPVSAARGTGIEELWSIVRGAALARPEARD